MNSESDKLQSDDYEKKKKLLLSNKGFENDLNHWVPLVDSLKIKHVPSSYRESCPNCSSLSSKNISKYLYYSNLVTLKECLSCKLVYSDILIDRKEVREHFEYAYKDDAYFINQRVNIFNEICEIVASKVRHGGRVLDVGGATGVFANLLKKKRPDLKVIVSDLSKTACEAAKEIGINAVNKALSELTISDFEDEKFDAILLIDVLYYETNLKEALSFLNNCLSDDGLIVYRGPNKFFLIKLINYLNVFSSAREKLIFFNPEHIYILRDFFLRETFKKIGFKKIQLIPSSSLSSKSSLKKIALKIIDCFSLIIFAICRKVISPSFIMLISRR